LIFAAEGFSQTRIFCDLGGVDRVLLFTMQGEPESVLQGLLTVVSRKGLELQANMSSFRVSAG
jgi:hypothetical protein